MELKNIALSAVTAGVLIWGGAAQAATYQFGTNISGNGGPAFGHFADVTVTDADADGNWEFSINAFGLNAVFGGTSSFITLLGVDTGFGHEPTSVSSISGPVGSVGLGTGPIGSPLGPLDYGFAFPTSGKGGGVLRLTDGEVVSWVANGMGTFTDIPADMFVIHVQGIGTAGVSDWYISPVPEPETYAMLLAGLGLIGFSLRRQK